MILYAVCVDEPTTLLKRVAQRVKEGGHDVPPDRVLARYPKTIQNLTQAVRQADVAFIYRSRDVSRGGPQLPAICQGDATGKIALRLPAWARQILGTSARRQV